MAHYEPMDYQLTAAAEPEDTEMCCMIAAELPTDTEMCCMIATELAPTDTEMSERQDRRYQEAAEDPYEDESEEEDEIPPPPPLVRQNAETGPHGRAGLSVREQELRYIEQHGLVDFCHGAIVTAILQDADYLLAQLTYLGRR
jgi:hypothetical protein